MIKKLFLIVIFTLLLSGCTSKEYEEITFSSWGSITEVKIIKAILSDFEKQNPNIKVNFMHIPQNYFQKLHLLFVTKSAPDVIFINNQYLPIYANYLENINCLIDKNKYYKASIDALSNKGILLAIPRDISNLVLYVNKDLLPQYKKIQTLKDLLELSQSATKNGTYGISFEEDVYWALPYLAYYGGGIIDMNSKNIFSTKESQEGLKFYKDLKDKYKVAPNKSQVGSSTLLQMFLDKKIAIYLSGRWSYPKIKEYADFNWTIEEFPTGITPQYADASGWAIYKETKHKEASYKLVEYLSSPESIQLLTQSGLIIPANIENSQLLNNKEHNQQAFISIATKSVNTPINKEYKKLTDSINTQFMDQ